MTEISVIVPFYNAQPYIQACITGLLAQHYPATAYEIILVDNNSTDASAEIVKQYPRVTLLTEKKQGAYAARNRGLMAATGRILAFTDADCVPEDTWLQNIATALRPAEVQLVIGSRRMGQNSVSLSLLAAHEHHQISFIFTQRLQELYYGYTNNMAVRREVFARVGPFLERARGADQILVRRVVDEYSCDAVRYAADIRVCHQELTSFWQYCQKLWIYGRSNRLCSEVVASRPLTKRERLTILRNTLHAEHYALPQAGLLVLLTVLSGAWYTLGRWTTAARAWRKTASAVSGENGSC